MHTLAKGADPGVTEREPARSEATSEPTCGGVFIGVAGREAAGVIYETYLVG